MPGSPPPVYCPVDEHMIQLHAVSRIDDVVVVMVRCLQNAQRYGQTGWQLLLHCSSLHVGGTWVPLPGCCSTVEMCAFVLRTGDGSNHRYHVHLSNTE
jgi:hypothetical protein